ncbi:MAG: hypothetical protein R3Y05_02605 [bacterium]
MEDLLGMNQPGYTYEEELNDNNETIGTYEFMKTIQTPSGITPKYYQNDVLGSSLEESDEEEFDISDSLDPITTNDGFIIPKYYREDTLDDSPIEEVIVEDDNDIIEPEVTEDKPKKQRKEYRCLDGHKVRSQAELDIDDILYNAFILHSYEKEVIEITQRKVLSDWYIPILPNQGIYIEYWGLNSNTYIKNKEEKINLYQENNLNLIQIEMDEIKDKTSLTNRLLKEIKLLKENIIKNI